MAGSAAARIVCQACPAIAARMCIGSRPYQAADGGARAAPRRAAIALDAATGEVLWVHGEREGMRGANAPRQLSGRGLAYWSDGREERILYVTPGYRLIALDAKTGVRVPSFGKDGAVDLKADAVYGTGTPIDLESGEIGIQSAPVVANTRHTSSWSSVSTLTQKAPD